MKLCIFTIVLDGFPWITKHLPVFQQLKCDWQWIVVEGAAMNNGSTRWCKEQEPRFSIDGTSEYLDSIIHEDHVTIIRDKCWQSKDDMCNTALSVITEPCVLAEIDSDELWQPWQLERIVERFSEMDDLDMMQFRCRYFVGPDLITQGHHCYGDMDYEWWRAWRFVPGMRWKSHEPPVLEPVPSRGYATPKDESDDLGLTFDHFPYANESQVAYKERFYGYDGLLEGWRRLQEVKEFPVPLKNFFPHVKTDLPLVVKV